MGFSLQFSYIFRCELSFNGWAIPPGPLYSSLWFFHCMDFSPQFWLLTVLKIPQLVASTTKHYSFLYLWCQKVYLNLAPQQANRWHLPENCLKTATFVQAVGRFVANSRCHMGTAIRAKRLPPVWRTPCHSGVCAVFYLQDFGMLPEVPHGAYTPAPPMVSITEIISGWQVKTEPRWIQVTQTTATEPDQPSLGTPFVLCLASGARIPPELSI